MSTPPLSFLNVPPGAGGTFSFSSLPPADLSNPTNEPPKHIGTTGCRTCVAVYFPIPPARFFLAHINVSVWIDKTRMPWSDILPQEGEDLKQAVMRALKTHAETEGWDPRTVGLPERAGSPLLMVCPGLVVGESKLKTTGWYVTEGIREVLGGMDGEGVDTGSQGFVVVGAPEGVVVKKMIAADRIDAMDGLDACGTEDMPRDWSFDVVRKEWCHIKKEWCSCDGMGLCYKRSAG